MTIAASDAVIEENHVQAKNIETATGIQEPPAAQNASAAEYSDCVKVIGEALGPGLVGTAQLMVETSLTA